MAISWGSNFVSIKYLLRTIDPADVILLRLTLGSIFFAFIVLCTARGLPTIERADWPRLALVAILGITVNTTAVTFGTQRIPAAVGSLVVTGNPVFTALLARLLIGEPLSRRKAVGIGVAFTGFLIVLLFGGPEAHFDGDHTLGVVITLLAPLCWAFYTVLSKPLLTRYDPTQFAGVVIILGTLPLLPALVINHQLLNEVRAFGPAQWLAAFAMSGFALVLAYALWYRGLRVLAPTQVAVYIYLVPAFGTLGAWLFLGEPITIFLLIGGLTILAGVILTNSTRRGPIATGDDAATASGSVERESLVRTEPGPRLAVWFSRTGRRR